MDEELSGRERAAILLSYVILAERFLSERCPACFLEGNEEMQFNLIGFLQ